MSLFSAVAGRSLSAGALLNGNAKAMLIPESFGMPVAFTLNPKTVKLEKSNLTEGNRGLVTHSFRDALRATSNIKFRLKDAHLTGAVATQAAIDQLVEWATPTYIDDITAGGLNLAISDEIETAGAAASALGTAVSGTSGTRYLGGGLTSWLSAPRYFQLPVLLFMWGAGGPLSGPLGGGTKVNLEKVEIDYQRFDWTGVPVWAKVDLTLIEYKTPKPFTNPSSGGVPGRTKHVVTGDEGVVQIATGAYGSPKAWRTVAEANDLDDPLRIKPGHVLHLPAPGER